MTEPGKNAPGLKGFPTPNTAAGIEAYLLFLFPDAEWAQYILGACETLQYAYNWYESGDLSPDDAAEALRVIVQQAPYNFIPRLSPQTTGHPPAFQTRFNPATGGFEVSTDGGSTWMPAPQADPRNITYLPPPSGGSAKCDAAERVRNVIAQLVQALITYLNDSAETATIVAGFFGILTPFIPGLAIAIEVFSLIIEAMAAVGAVLIEAAFDLPTFEAILCQIYCHLPSGVAITRTDLDTIEAAMTANLSGTASLVTNYMLELMGVGGFNDIAAAATDTGDCSGCGCQWCFTFDFTVDDGGWTPIVFASDDAVYTPGVGWQVGTNNGCEIGISIPIATGEITEAHIVLANPFAGGASRCAVSPYSGSPLVVHANGDFTGLSYTDGVRAFYSIDFGGTCAAGANDNTITSIVLRGTGDCPFGDPNCI